VSDYKYLGNFAACEPWAAQGMQCHECQVSWTGCWDNFQCPRCGQGELPSQYNPALVESVLKADAAPTEATFDNVDDMLKWLEE
jgi:hypothetical protein